MNRFPLVFLFFWLFPVTAESAAQISVSFQAEATVTEAKIVLADIAVIQPEGNEATVIGKLPVASAPAPGGTKELYTVTVITSLRNRAEVAGVDWKGSEKITVHRKGNNIKQEQLKKIIDDYLKENEARLPKAEIQLTTFRSPEEILLPAGEVTWKVTPSRPDIISSASFSIAFAVNGKPAGNCIVRGKIEAYGDVVTAVSTLHKGDLITDDKVTITKQRIDKLTDPIFTVEELKGMQVARTIPAGSPIEQEQIDIPPLIKEGDLVKIHAQKGALNISTSGIAREDGRLGRTIQVKNVSSNKLIHCRVDGPGIVSVEF